MSFKGLKLFLGKRSPEILTVVSVIGIVATVVTASQDTIKAQDILKKMKPRDKREAIKITWKCYIPTAISATTTCLSIFGITPISKRKLYRHTHYLKQPYSKNIRRESLIRLDKIRSDAFTKRQPRQLRIGKLQ